MAWCRQAASHYLNQYWPRSMTPCGVTRSQCVNSPLPGNKRNIVDIGSDCGLLLCDIRTFLEQSLRLLAFSWCPFWKCVHDISHNIFKNYIHIPKMFAVCLGDKWVDIPGNNFIDNSTEALRPCDVLLKLVQGKPSLDYVLKYECCINPS